MGCNRLQARDDDTHESLDPLTVGAVVPGGVTSTYHQIDDVVRVDVTSNCAGGDCSLAQHIDSLVQLVYESCDS